MSTVLDVSQPCEVSNQCERAVSQTSVRDGNCSYDLAWNLLGKRWTFLIITQLLARPQSFQELFVHTHGISETVLSKRLKELEREGVLGRQIHTGRLLRVMYSLTEKGEALAPVIRAINIWCQHL